VHSGRTEGILRKSQGIRFPAPQKNEKESQKGKESIEGLIRKSHLYLHLPYLEAKR
jgi:hypothetical protein